MTLYDWIKSRTSTEFLLWKLRKRKKKMKSVCRKIWNGVRAFSSARGEEADIAATLHGSAFYDVISIDRVKPKDSTFITYKKT